MLGGEPRRSVNVMRTSCLAGILLLWVSSSSPTSPSSSCTVTCWTPLNTQTGRSPPQGRNDNAPPPPKTALLILGMGRVGRLLAKQATPHFDVIYGTKRLPDAAATAAFVTIRKDPTVAGSAQEGIQELPFHADAVASALASCACTHVLITTPPIQQQGDATNSSSVGIDLPFANIIEQHLATTTHAPAWIGVLSTTGVYGHYQGDWVTESSPCLCPAGSSAAKYLEWEQAWAQWSRYNVQASCRIFRCAGIYGASRSSLHTLYKRGLDPTSKRSSDTTTAGTGASGTGASGTGKATRSRTKTLSVTNRIHEMDLSAAVLASMRMHQERGALSMHDFEIYNLSDDLPESRKVVFDYAKQLFASRGIDTPVQSQLACSSNATTATQSKRSVRRGQEVKRVCNQKMKEQLSPNLFFPTYKQGLANILEQPDAPWFFSA